MTTLADESRSKLAAALVSLREKRDRFASGSERYLAVQGEIDPLQKDYDALVKRYFA